jgi:hypothetical protein
VHPRIAADWRQTTLNQKPEHARQARERCLHQL